MKCLIIDEMHPSIIPGLEDLGFEAVYEPGISRKEIISQIDQFTGIIVRSKTEIDSELLAPASKLKFVARAGAGIEQVDIEFLNEHNIALINAPEGNRDALAEHAIGLILALCQNIVRGDREVRSGIWDREGNRGVEIKGKTIGLVGFGFMGSALAQRLQSFGCKVIAYDKYKQKFSNQFARQVAESEIFEDTDILSLHVPQTEETLGFFNKSYFNKFKKDIVLLNTSRGGILNLYDLADLLDNGKIRAAALDVLENEKLKTWNIEEKAVFERLASHDNVVFTPHVGGWTFESYKRINDVILSKIKSLIRQN